MVPRVRRRCRRIGGCHVFVIVFSALARSLLKNAFAERVTPTDNGEILFCAADEHAVCIILDFEKRNQRGVVQCTNVATPFLMDECI